MHLEAGEPLRRFHVLSFAAVDEADYADVPLPPRGRRETRKTA
jgi:hypothetical protein